VRSKVEIVVPAEQYFNRIFFLSIQQLKHQINLYEMPVISETPRLYCQRDTLDEINGHPQGPNLLIKHVRLPHADRNLSQQLVNVACSGGRVWKILDVAETSTVDSSFGTWREVDGKQGLLIPS